MNVSTETYWKSIIKGQFQAHAGFHFPKQSGTGTALGTGTPAIFC
jgi:hypothetical protein